MSIGNGNVLVAGVGGFRFSISASRNKGAGLLMAGFLVPLFGTLNLDVVNNDVVNNNDAGISIGFGTSILSTDAALNVPGNKKGIPADGADTVPVTEPC